MPQPPLCSRISSSTSKNLPGLFLLSIIIIIDLAHPVWIEVCKWLYLTHLWVVMMVMAAMHGVEWVVLMMVMLVVMKATLRAEGLWIGSRGGGGVGE